MRAKLLIIMVLAGTLNAQMSYRNLSSELLKDLGKAISDTTTIPAAQIFMNFNGETPLDRYFNEVSKGIKYSETDESLAPKDSVNIDLISCSLVVNHIQTETLRNTDYMRQLDLNLRFRAHQTEYEWQGKVSDKLTKAELKTILPESFPVKISGDYFEGEPAVYLVTLTTLTVFSLVAALFFIRT